MNVLNEKANPFANRKAIEKDFNKYYKMKVFAYNAAGETDTPMALEK